MCRMIAVVGLGNPGRRYALTRHNVGFSFIDQLSGKHGIPVNKSGFNALYGIGDIGPRRVILSKPQTFMNRSGEAVISLLAYYKIGVEALVVVHDEIDLPLGKIKVKKGGGDAGHRGLASITCSVGSPEYYRLRFGVGRPGSGESVSQYVLSGFAVADSSSLENSLLSLEEMFEKLLDELP